MLVTVVPVEVEVDAIFFEVVVAVLFDVVVFLLLKFFFSRNQLLKSPPENIGSN